MTTERLAEIRACCEKATPGPWWIGARINEKLVRIKSGGDGRPVQTVLYATDEYLGSVDITEADVSFILAARTAIPELLDEVEKLKAEVERLEQWDRDV